jgi:hypothetical protein
MYCSLRSSKGEPAGGPGAAGGKRRECGTMESRAVPDLGEMAVWNLADLYPGP